MQLLPDIHAVDAVKMIGIDISGAGDFGNRCPDGIFLATRLSLPRVGIYIPEIGYLRAAYAR